MARDVAEMLTNTAKAIAATDRCLRDVKRSPLRCAVKELIANRNGFVFTLQVGMPTSA